jgi:hypothetical protein
MWPDDKTERVAYWRIWQVMRPNIFSNPFPLRDPENDDERAANLVQFADYWYADEQQNLRNRAFMTFPPDAVLGCVCHPKPCHADIIAGYLNWRRYGRPKEEDSNA